MINCPAFPVTFMNKYPHEVNDPFGLPVPAEGGVTYPGLTRREYFALEMMKGMMSMDRAGDYIDERTGQENDDGSGELFLHTRLFAVEACMLADTLIAELENGK